jgi:tRNA G10  N-methylase Trm11
VYYFFLGNTPALSRLELASLLPEDISEVTPQIVEYTHAFSLANMAPKLGGTRKIARKELQGKKTEVSQLLSQAITSVTNKNVAVTDYVGCDLGKGDLHSLKAQVSRPLRFVSMETGEHELVMLAHQHVAELNILPAKQDDEVIIALTIWIFDAEDWIKRDRSKPYRDIKRGMLPPKLARILANLATKGEKLAVYDPFCGTGTVLTEAALAGATSLYGSDTYPEAIKGAQANLEWVIKTYNLPTPKVELQPSDATHPPFKAVDCIATEPYMGPLLDDRNPLSLEKIKDIAKGLDKLYRGAFKAWLPLLPTGGRVVMTIPTFAVYGRLIPTIKLDSLEGLGYNYVSSVAYGKPGAAVVRNITILEKK